MAAIFGGMVSGLISTSLLIAIAIFNGSCSLEHVVLVFLFAMSLSFLSALFLLHRKIGLFAKFAALELRPILMLVLPFLFANLGNIVLTRADIWILGMYVGDADVALYGAAARIVMLLNTPLIISAALLAGTIAQLNHRGDKAKLQQVVQLVPTVLTAPALILIAIFIFLGDEILLLIYGAEYYRAAWPVLIILALGQLACLWAGVSIQALFMTNSQLSVVTVTLLCTFFAIVASLLVVESHGITGVAIVFAIGTSLQSIACVFISRARLGINTSISFRSLFAARNALEALTAVRKRRPETK
jgi:O-antigen/teichoic acid export membrane protein